MMPGGTEHLVATHVDPEMEAFLGCLVLDDELLDLLIGGAVVAFGHADPGVWIVVLGLEPAVTHAASRSLLPPVGSAASLDMERLRTS
jgi:hypothetical protein